MKTPEWELAVLIAAPHGTEVTIAGEVWRKVMLRYTTYWCNAAGDVSFSLGLMRRIREARTAHLEG